MKRSRETDLKEKDTSKRWDRNRLGERELGGNSQETSSITIIINLILL